MSTITKDLGVVTAYGYYKAGGGTMTESEFTQFMVDFGAASKTATEAAQAAAESAQTSAAHSADAQDSAEEARQSASIASARAIEADTAAGASIDAKNDAVTAQTAAQTAKTQAESARDEAQECATRAETAAESIDFGLDPVPTQGSNNAVSSGGVYEALHNTDTTLSQSGQAADAKKTGDTIDVLKTDLSRLSKYGAKNVCPTAVISRTYQGVTLTSNGDGIFSITGTAGANVHNNIYANNSSFPDGIKAGDTLTGYVQTTNDNIRFYVMWWVGGTKIETNDNWMTSGYKKFAIPNDATGMEIRISVMKNTVTSNDTVIPFLFADKLKHDYDEEIETNNTDISSIKSLMPYGYAHIETTATEGLVNKWNQISDPSGYSYIKQSVVVGDKYKASGYYYGGNYPAYIILNGDSVLSYYNPDNTGAFDNIEITIPANATHLVVNGFTNAQAMLSKYGMVKAASSGHLDSVVVGVGKGYLYNNINAAVLKNVGSVIAVDYGTYETEIENLATDKTIIGKDKDLCIMTGTDRDYETPPIETSGGIIKHFTVNMVNADGVSHAGYCLHSDTSSCIGKTLIVEDCKFNCEGQHTIGMGIWPDESVLYKNCEFIFDDSEETPEHAPFFAHNAGESTGEATVRFHNCIFRGTGYALKLSSYSGACIMHFEFIGCTFESGTLSGENMIWTDYVSGDTHDQSNLHRFKGKMPLLATSHGNNISILNYGG